VRVRRLLGALATGLVALAGAVGLLAFFAARDTAPVDRAGAEGPGRAYADQGARHLPRGTRERPAYNSAPPTSGAHVPAPVRRDRTRLSDDQLLHALEAGNVVLVYGTPSPPARLEALARAATGGRFDAALAEAGQAAILVHRPGARGVVALAWRHLLRVPSARDPELRRFVDHWLGRGAGG
jgi:hypothetical protein